MPDVWATVIELDAGTQERLPQPRLRGQRELAEMRATEVRLGDATGNRESQS
jgi:hypothetical protein